MVGFTGKEAYSQNELDRLVPYGTIVFTVYEMKYVCFGECHVTKYMIDAICASYDINYAFEEQRETPYICSFKTPDKNGVFIAPPNMPMKDIGKYVKASYNNTVKGEYIISDFSVPDYLQSMLPKKDYMEANEKRVDKNRDTPEEMKEKMENAKKWLLENRRKEAARKTSDEAKNQDVRQSGKKYELTHTNGEKKGFHGVRIRALKDFGDVKKGELGGYVQSEYNLSQEGNCWIYDQAFVVEKSKVSGDAMICGDAIVHGKSLVYDNAIIAGESDISGQSEIYENCRLYGRTWVEDSKIHGNAVLDATDVSDGSDVYEDVVVGNNVVARAKLHGTAHPDYDADITNCDYTEKDDR